MKTDDFLPVALVSGTVMTAIHWDEPGKIIGSFIGVAIVIGIVAFARHLADRYMGRG